jgi:hypothetical protein
LTHIQLAQGLALNTMSYEGSCEEIIAMPSQHQVPHLILNREIILCQEMPGIFGKAICSQVTQALERL